MLNHLNIKPTNMHPIYNALSIRKTLKLQVLVIWYRVLACDMHDCEWVINAAAFVWCTFRRFYRIFILVILFWSLLSLWFVWLIAQNSYNYFCLAAHNSWPDCKMLRMDEANAYVSIKHAQRIRKAINIIFNQNQTKLSQHSCTKAY